MSNIKFIIDDLANYTGDLLTFNKDIVYLPKGLLVDNDIFVKTSNTWTDELKTLLEVSNNISPSIITESQYEDLLVKFLNTFTDYDFIYFKPYTFGIYDDEISDIVSVVEDINQRFNNRIHIFETDHYGGTLHFLIHSVINSYNLNRNLTINELKNISDTINSKLISYVFTTKINWLKNKWPCVDSENVDWALFKMENKVITYIPINDSLDELKFMYNCIDFVSDKLNKLSTYDIYFSTFPIYKDTYKDLYYFLSKLEQQKTLTVNESSQSECVLSNNGMQLSVYII